VKRLKLYLETSIFGFMVGTRQSPFTEATERLFQEIRAGHAEAFTSTEVTRELANAPEPLRTDLLRVLRAYRLTELEATEEARELAEKYLEAGIIPRKAESGDLHIATAVVNNLDVVVSWNLQQIVKTRTRLGEWHQQTIRIP
jgi:hypothetical protein